MSRLGTSAGPWLESTTIESTDNGGSETVETWVGSESEVLTKSYLLRATGAKKISRSPKGNGDWQVRASFPFDNDDPVSEPFVDTMELEVNAVMRSVYQSPVFKSRFGSVDRWQKAVAMIADCARKYQSGQPTINDSGYYQWRKNGTEYSTKELAIENELRTRLNTIGGLTSQETTDSVNLLYNIMMRGVVSILEYDTVFRRTITAGNPNEVRASFTGAGKIWTTDEVVAFENIPSDGWFVLPAGKQWHKSKPQVLSVYGQKTQLTYTYIEIEIASALLYQPYNSAALLDA